MLKAIAAKLISSGFNVIIVATTAIAAMNYRGALTAHSAFGIIVRNEVDLDTNEQISCVPNGERAERIRKCNVIIWDEFPMGHKIDILAVHELCGQLLAVPYLQGNARPLPQCNASSSSSVAPNGCDSAASTIIPFGNIHFIGAGDFRQIAPVVPYGNQNSIVNSSIITSLLFRYYFKIHRLTVAVRDASDGPHSRLVDAIGNGFDESLDRGQIDQSYAAMKDNVRFKGYVRLHGYACTLDVDRIIDFIYPDIGNQVNNSNPVDIASHVNPVMNNRILCTNNKNVIAVNEKCLNRLQGNVVELTGTTEFAQESLNHVAGSVSGRIIPVFLADGSSHNPIGHPEIGQTAFSKFHHNNVPDHTLKLKVGAIAVLIRNIDQAAGLVNNVRVVIETISENIVLVGIKKSNGEWRHLIPIPRVSFRFCVKRTRIEVLRRQFPISLDYACTFHRSQGQTLDKVAIDLREPVFTHGQLYVAMGRVRQARNIILLAKAEQIVNGVVIAASVTFQELLLPNNVHCPFKLCDANPSVANHPAVNSVAPPQSLPQAASLSSDAQLAAAVHAQEMKELFEDLPDNCFDDDADYANFAHTEEEEGLLVSHYF